MDLAGKRVLVVGLGRSGLAVAHLAIQRGALVTVTDKRGEDALKANVAALPPSVKLELGGHQQSTFTGADLIVLSPGVPEIPELVAARAAGVTITGELELASRFVQAPIIGITGTNGKSTTTTLIGAILRASGINVFVGGNLGEPLVEAVGTPAAQQSGVCVVEVSSFQLETANTFRPRVAVLLNISADHLDRYDGMRGYIAAKARIFMNQGSDDFAVVNTDDKWVTKLIDHIPSRWLEISTQRVLNEGGWIENKQLWVRLPGCAPESYPADLPGLIGRHNHENALASLVAARLAGATQTEARRALLAFRPLAHRMELVTEMGRVAYFDDSKGTNVGAVVAALDGFPRPVVLIAGGRDKGGDYTPLADALKSTGRAVVLIGEAADRMEAALTSAIRVRRAGSMEEAVTIASSLAQPGDAVVLSPACSSFDMFRDYEHRAQVFRAAVRALAGEEPAS